MLLSLNCNTFCKHLYNLYHSANNRLDGSKDLFIILLQPCADPSVLRLPFPVLNILYQRLRATNSSHLVGRGSEHTEVRVVQNLQPGNIVHAHELWNVALSELSTFGSLLYEKIGLRVSRVKSIHCTGLWLLSSCCNVSSFSSEGMKRSDKAASICSGCPAVL